MKPIRTVLAVMSVILIILILIYMNYSDLSWSANRISYLGLAACLLNIWALIFLIKERE
jgi:predicted ferric reductase